MSKAVLFDCMLIERQVLFFLYTASGTYEPTARYEHKAVVVDRNVYVWAGLTDKLPRTHNSLEKIECLSSVDVLNQDSGNWMCQPTSGTPPLGVCGYACASVGDMIYFFGGWCGHGGCSHNGVHKLSTLSLQWESLSPTTSEDGAPMRKAYCGMVAFKDEGMDILFVVGGQGTTITCRQPGALYEENHGHYRCNEQHMFSLKESKYLLCITVAKVANIDKKYVYMYYKLSSVCSCLRNHIVH